MRNILSALTLALLLALPCLSMAQESVLTPREAHALLQNPPASLTVLDVRTPEEFAQGHVPGAVNADFFGPRFEQQLGALDKSKTYLVYCRTDNRSGQAVDMMRAQSFSKIVQMKGGITEWNREQLPTEK